MIHSRGWKRWKASAALTGCAGRMRRASNRWATPRVSSDDIRSLDSNDKIAYVDKIGDHFNLWQDADHLRGIWRRTTLAEHRKGQAGLQGNWPSTWTLNESEGKRRVWHGADCLAPTTSVA